MFHGQKKMSTKLILDDSKVPKEKNLNQQYAKEKYSFCCT